jgi:hypothetical protein
MYIDIIYKNKSGHPTKYTNILNKFKIMKVSNMQNSINNEMDSLLLHNLLKRDSIFYKA